MSSTVSVAIEPGAPTVVANTPQPFLATVTGASNTGVTWSVQESGGGDISPTGVYIAPAPQGTYHVVATSQADSCVSASIAVTVVPAPTITVAIDPPGPVDVEVQGSVRFLATVTGSANTAVVWSVPAGGACGQIVNGVYGAPTTPCVAVVVATSVADPTKSTQAEVHVLASTPSALISPTAVTVGLGGQLQLALSRDIVSGGWMVEGVTNGNSTVGTISPTGLYTAPFQIPAPTTMVNVTKTFAPNSSSAVTLASRFLPAETLHVDDCVPQCAIDEPNSIVAADFNGDGFSDLATSNAGTGTVSLLISADASHFAAPTRLQVGDPSTGDPQALVAERIDQGSKFDLVIADADLTVSPSRVAVRTRLGEGDGTFGATEGATALPSNSNPLSMAVGQFDSNGHLDVAVANFKTNTVDVLFGVGDGTFPVINTITTGVSAPLGLAVADVNGDGSEDFAVANSGNDTVSVFLSNGAGAFASPQIIQLPANSSPTAVAAVTLNNGDNYPDLVVTTTGSNGGVTVIFNSADGNPLADPRFDALGPSIATGSFPVAVAIGNFNHDATPAPDVVVANQGDDTVTTYFFDSVDNVLVQSETYTVGQTPQALAVGDFNGDGWADVAVANRGDDTVSILRNRGGPTTTSP